MAATRESDESLRRGIKELTKVNMPVTDTTRETLSKRLTVLGTATVQVSDKGENSYNVVPIPSQSLFMSPVPMHAQF